MLSVSRGLQLSESAKDAVLKSRAVVDNIVDNNLGELKWVGVLSEGVWVILSTVQLCTESAQDLASLRMSMCQEKN